MAPTHLLMRRSLDASTPVPVWPAGYRLGCFSPLQARDAHALLVLGYQAGGGTVPSFETWWAGLSQDGEYDPALVFPVRDTAGRLAGIAQCWTGAFVKDLVVHPDHRRRGLGRALLLHAFCVFRARGAMSVELKVLRDNPSGAIPFYRSLGMFSVGA